MTDFDSEVLDALYESSSKTKDEDVNPYDALLNEYSSDRQRRDKQDARLREQSIANAPPAPEDREEDFYRQEEETEGIMQNLLPSIIDESYERARDMAAGGAGVVSGLGGGFRTIESLGKEYLNRDLGIGKLGDVLTEIGNASQEIYATENPDIYNQIGNAVGSMAIFAGMGGGASGLAKALTTSARAANLLGLSTMTGLEAFTEGGNVANQMLQLTGGDEDAAQRAFGKAFGMNLAVLAPTNYLAGYFGGDEALKTARQVFGKMSKGSFGEGFQEGLQEVIQAYAMGEDLFTKDLGKRALESTFIGGFVGGPTAVATNAATDISRESQQIREREQVQKAQEQLPGIPGIRAKYQGQREQLQAKREKDTHPAENAEAFYQSQLEILRQQESQEVLKEREKVSRNLEKIERELESVQANRQGYIDNYGERASESAIRHYDTKIQELQTRLMEQRQSLGLNEQEQDQLQSNLEYIQQKQLSGEMDPGAAAIAKRLILIDPDFDRNSTLRVSSEVMEATEDILEQEGLAGADPEEYAVTGRTRTKIENDALKTAIDLYRGHDADTMVEEWYHRGFSRMSAEDRTAFEAYHKEVGDNRSLNEHFAQEGRDFFFSERLHEDAGPIRKLFARARDGLLNLIGRIRKIRGAKIPDKIQELYRKAAEGQASEQQVIEDSESAQVRKRETIRELKDTEEGRVVIPEETWQKLESKIKKNIIKEFLPKQRKADAEEIKDLKTRIRRLKTDLNREWSEHVKTMKRLGKKVANAEYKEQVLRERYEKKIQDIKAKYANKEQKQRDRKEFDKIVKSIKRLVKRKIPGTYRDRVNSILENLELVRRSKKTMETRLEVREWVEELRDAGEIVPPWLEDELRKAEKVNLNQIDLPTLRNIHAAIKQTVHLGTQRNKFLSEKRRYTIDQAVNQMVKTIDREHKIGPAEEIKGPRSPEPQKTQFKNAYEKMEDVFGEHRKVEFIARELDGFKEGLVQDYLIDPVQQAWNAEAQRSFEDGQVISKAVRLLEKDSKLKGVRNQVVDFGKFKLTREQMMAVYANTGNPGNLARLIHPNGWNFSEADLQSIENALTTNEKKFVRKMADLINSKWEDVARVTEELTGERPEKVEGDWYWPIVTDKNLIKQLKFADKTQDMFNDIFERIQVERGFTIKRVGGQEPVSLDFFKVLMNHLNQVNHYVTHAPAVRDVSRMLKSSILSDAMRRSVGEQSWKQFQPWLRSVANPKGIGKDALEGVAGKLRRNATMAILGLKLSVSMLQVGSYTQTMHEVGIKNSIKGLLDFYMNPIKWQDKYRKIMGLSTQMRFRQTTFDRDVRNWLETDNMKALVRGKPSAGNMLFSLIRAVDIATTLPTWWAAYNQMLNKTRGDIKRSVKYADGVVRRTQPAGSVKDLAQVSKGSEWKKLFTMFYTHYSNYHNQMTNHIRKTKKRGASIPNLVEFTTGVGLLMVVPGLIGTFIRSAGTEDDPSEYFKGLIGYAAGGIIGIRDLVRLATIDWGRDITTTGLKGPADIAVSMRYFQQAISEPSKRKKKEKLKRAGKALTKGTGTTFGFIPLQFWYVIDAALSGSGDWREFVFGKYAIKKKKKKVFYG